MNPTKPTPENTTQNGAAAIGTRLPLTLPAEQRAEVATWPPAARARFDRLAGALEFVSAVPLEVAEQHAFDAVHAELARVRGAQGGARG